MKKMPLLLLLAGLLPATLLAQIISVEPESIDFDRVDVGENSEETITIRNSGDDNLIIRDVNLTDPDRFHFHVDFNNVITIRRNSSRRIGVHFVPLWYGERNATLTIESNDDTQPRITIPLTGFGEMDPDSIIDVPEDFETIRQALNAAGDPARIHLANRIYRGDANTNLIFEREVYIYSDGNPDSCIIDFEGSMDGIVMPHGGTIKGITFTGGHGSVITVNSPRDDWFSIRDCVIESNYPRSINRGAITINNSSNGEIKHTIIQDNRGTNYGGLVLNYGSDVVLRSCVIADNSGGNVGGIAVLGRTVNMFNCLIIGNSGRIGGGVSIQYRGSDYLISNCTFFGNTASDNGGGLYKTRFAEVELENCIFWENDAPEGPQIGAEARYDRYEVDQCLVQGGGFGGEFGDNGPEFVNGRIPIWGKGGFFLTDDSPCVDAGNHFIRNRNYEYLSDYTTRLDGATEERWVDIGYHYYIGDLSPFGSLRGQVTTNDATPIIGSEIITSQGHSTLTDSAGEWELPFVNVADDVTVTASAAGCLDSTVSELNIQEDETVTIEFTLRHPVISLSTDAFYVELDQGDSTDIEFELRNDGDANLNWTVTSRLIGDAGAERYSKRHSPPLPDEIGNVQAVAFIDRYYYIVCYSDTVNWIYMLNQEGEIVLDYPQFGMSYQGISDLTWD